MMLLSVVRRSVLQVSGIVLIQSNQLQLHYLNIYE
jgi:hypothetical protein